MVNGPECAEGRTRLPFGSEPISENSTICFCMMDYYGPFCENEYETLYSETPTTDE